MFATPSRSWRRRSLRKRRRCSHLLRFRGAVLHGGLKIEWSENMWSSPFLGIIGFHMLLEMHFPITWLTCYNGVGQMLSDYELTSLMRQLSQAFVLVCAPSSIWEFERNTLEPTYQYHVRVRFCMFMWNLRCFDQPPTSTEANETGGDSSKKM